jgi:hypothetical protein
MAVAQHEQQLDRRTVDGREPRLLAQPLRKAVQDRTNGREAEPCAVVERAGAAQQRALRLIEGAAAADRRIEQRRSVGLQPQLLLDAVRELFEMHCTDAEPGRRLEIGDAVIAEMQDLRRRDLQRCQHVLEQPARLVDAVFARAEHAVDQRCIVRAERACQQRTQFGFRQVRVADDYHLQTRGLGRAHKLQRRRKAEAVFGLGRELAADRGVDCGVTGGRPGSAVDVPECHFVAAIAHEPQLARCAFGEHALTAIQPHRRRVENVGRMRGRAPHQRVEAVE